MEKSNSKFFTNHVTDTLFAKFKGIIEGMTNLHSFHAVVGYFRSSGYFKIRKEFEQMENPPKIKILIGINIDNIFRRHNKSMLFMAGDKVSDEAREQYRQDFIEDVKNAGYYEDIEKGILMLAEDMSAGQVELKIHPTRDLHAKFYLFLPEKHTQHSDGWVIMGSSNLSNSGLGLTQPPRYELNVSMKDYDDVAFCKAEFDKLWKEGLSITFEDIEQFKKETHLGQTPTPYELYMKILISHFGNQLEDDFSLQMPKGFTEYVYQTNAVKQGYQMLRQHNGFFLADVVGLGKTVVAAMIAKRFIEENGVKKTKILVVYPPALANNWKDTFERFEIRKQTQFITNGSLNKILDEDDNYWAKEDFDLILVDEAHRFRTESSDMYAKLQLICKAGRENGEPKKIMLISATPLNNRPDDLYNLLQLFQDKRNSTIDGISNLQTFFSPLIREYKEMMSPKNDSVDVAKVDKLYETIRKKVLDKVTVRRTRENIRKNFPEDFATINFPVIEKPREIEYLLHDELKLLFEQAMDILTNKETGLKYARYKAIERFIGDYQGIYENAERTSANLAMIYKTHMVKRLESSFHAFRISLRNLAGATQGMLDMFAADKVIIAPEWKVKDLQREGKDIEEIIQMGIDKFGDKSEKFAVYPADAFDPAFVEDLKYDLALLNEQIALWDKVTIDPKFERFIEYIETQVFDTKINPTGKLVVFSESKDTVTYLNEELAKRVKKGIIAVSSEDRKRLFETIQENFDANIEEGKKKNDIDIIISTDVLAEGVNLHRANVIVNYDTPWNASRLMQRIGRVNRIGSVAGTIVNYMFYPSAEGDKEIRLYKNALTKLQGFHSAYGEDSQIYSREEIVQQFDFDNNDSRSDDVDATLEFMREARDFFKNSPEEYERIKQLPDKSRTGRTANENCKANTSLVFVSSPYKESYYHVIDRTARPMDFLEAAGLFKAAADEPSQPLPSMHHTQVGRAQHCYDEEVVKMLDDNSKVEKNEYNDKDLKKDGIVRKFLLRVAKETSDESIPAKCDVLVSLIEKGTYSALSRKYQRLKKLHWASDKLPVSDIENLEKQIRADVAKYNPAKRKPKTKPEDITARIVLSESFV